MSEWEPIATAPRDGTEVVLFRHGWGFCPVAVWMEYPGNPVEREEGGWMEGWGFELDVNLGREEGWLGWSDDKMPTHWMPLPAPADAALTKMLAEERAKGMEEAGRCPQCEARENTFLESIRIKQECPHCGYQSIDWRGENAACPMLDCHGGLLTVPNRAAEVREKNDAR